MSKISIAGDASGTGTLTIAAPNTNTNRTLNIPDSDGTFLISGTTVTVPQGGTGATTLTANNVLLGNGTSAVQVVAPGTSGNLLTSNGTTWTSAAPASTYGGSTGQVFTGNGTFTIPTGITRVKVTVIGGGGGGTTTAIYWGAGGGAAIGFLTGLTPGNTIAVTIGAGGAYSSPGGTGGTSQISSGTQTITTISATGGVGGNGANATGNGGVGSNGNINLRGSTGQGHVGTSANGVGFATAVFSANNVVATPNFGNGGAPSNSCAWGSGTAGAAGLIFFEW